MVGPLPQQIFNFPSNLFTRFDETAKQFTSVIITGCVIQSFAEWKFWPLDTKTKKNNKILLL